jgi:predicted enzyme related to lactoylglutathione lyase
MSFARVASLMARMLHIRATPLVHLELHTGDVERARAFYAGLCGWRPEQIRTPYGEYLAMEWGGGVGAGIVGSAVQHPLWLPYVQVSEIGRATERALALGAVVLLGPREGPAGWRSVVRTAEAGELAFWQPKR